MFKNTKVKNTKICFCVGINQCKDENCELVKEYKRKQNANKNNPTI